VGGTNGFGNHGHFPKDFRFQYLSHLITKPAEIFYVIQPQHALLENDANLILLMFKGQLKIGRN